MVSCTSYAMSLQRMYGIMYQLRYEFAANEGSMLNGLELDHPEMTIFDLCEDFKKIDGGFT